MITYEANILCDKCAGSAVAGAPMSTPDDAVTDAAYEAVKRGWVNTVDLPDNQQWLCHDCKENK